MLCECSNTHTASGIAAKYSQAESQKYSLEEIILEKNRQRRSRDTYCSHLSICRADALGKKINMVFLYHEERICRTGRLWELPQAHDGTGGKRKHTDWPAAKKGAHHLHQEYFSSFKATSWIQKAYHCTIPLPKNRNSLVTNAHDTSVAFRQHFCQGPSLPSSWGHLRVAWQLWISKELSELHSSDA